ncbi:hypothetical protein GF420_11805, partial [candidate division GN15 bacterium]|nr:hypothetical protein [candidate division GN15 bacterium]
GVFELGISTPGEMAKLAVILGPQLVLITNVGPSHLEFLGSVEQVAKEKLSLLEGSPDARLIVNADNAILMAEAAKTGREIVTFGIDNEADWRPDSIESDREGNTRVVIEGNPFRVPLFGRHQVSNLLAAYAITRELGYSFKDVNTGSITLSTAPLRGERLELHGVTIIADCYNANPDSVTAGLRSLTRLQRSGRLFVVLGDMLELGEHSRDYHRQVGTLLATLDYDRVLLVGPLSTAILDGALEGGASPSRLTHYETADACADILTDELGAGDLLYVKGSRGIGLEKLIDHWRKYGGEG